MNTDRSTALSTARRQTRATYRIWAISAVLTLSAFGLAQNAQADRDTYNAWHAQQIFGKGKATVMAGHGSRTALPGRDASFQNWNRGRFLNTRSSEAACMPMEQSRMAATDGALS